MPWRPSRDKTLQRDDATPLWSVIQPVFDAATPLAPLPRRDVLALQARYVRRRKNDSPHLAELGAKVPDSARSFGLGATDVELLDFLLHYSEGRVLRIVGPRGAGKTSLVHFVEAALENAQLHPCPQLLILNGLQLNDHHVASSADFIGLIREELRQHSLAPDDSGLKAAFDAARAILELDSSVEGLRRSVRQLRDGLPGRDIMLVTFVFDNLDHHRAATIQCACEVAREIMIASGLGSIVCMRPGASTGVSRSSTSAFFTYWLPLFTPSADAWLQSLRSRIVAALAEHFGSNALTVRGVRITPEALDVAFGRFTELLLHRRAEDDALTILEAVSANDTRHLIRLVRRILSHRSLPDEWLLGVTNERPDFHPLTALIEGSRRLFKGDEDLPNLLCYTDGAGNSELLLSFRILTFLDSSQNPIPTERLIRWLQELGYQTEDVIGCLIVLMTAHLVGASDSEIVAQSEPLPSDFFLTEAGQFYLHRLLHYADYLTAVIVDVPLEHREIREGSPDQFSARLRSLIEMADEVRHREDRQIAALASHQPSPELRRVAEAMSKGGLLTAALADGLADAVSRGRNSRVPAVQTAVEEASEMHQHLRRWLSGADRRLREVVNRGRRAMTAPTTPVLRKDEGVHVTIDVGRMGDDLQMSAEVRTSVPVPAAFVALHAVSEGGSFSHVTPAVAPRPGEPDPSNPSRISNRQEPHEVLKGNFPDLTSGVSVADEHLSMQVVSVPRPNGIGLLSADEENGRLRLRFYLINNGVVESYDLGSASLTADIREWSVGQLDAIGNLVTLGKPFRDKLRTVGANLCRKLLSQSGQNTLTTLYRQAETVLVFCAHPEIPWELLCPPAGEDPLLPLIGDHWRTVRWFADPMLGPLNLLVSEAKQAALPMMTVGLPPSTTAPWRHASPSSMDELKALIVDTETLHLVGHWNSDGSLEIADTDFRLDADMVYASGLAGPSSIIVSACGAGATELAANLPAALSLQARSRRVVWSPIVKLRDVDALSIDDSLAAFLAEHEAASAESYMRFERKQNALLSLYVRYGLNRSGGGNDRHQ